MVLGVVVVDGQIGEGKEVVAVTEIGTHEDAPALVVGAAVNAPRGVGVLQRTDAVGRNPAGHSAGQP